MAFISPGRTQDAESTSNGALRAVKRTEEGNDSHVDLNRPCSRSPVTMNPERLHRVYLPWRTTQAD